MPLNGNAPGWRTILFSHGAFRAVGIDYRFGFDCRFESAMASSKK
jgi:hypothetical protein